MAAYDPAKAALFNKLRQQGLSIGDAARQAGIADQAGDGTYVITGKNLPDPPGGTNPNPGTIGAPVEGTQKRLGVDYDNISAADAAENARFDRGLDSSSNFEEVDYQVAAKNPPGSKVTPINYVTTSTETVSGGGSTTVTSGPRIPNATSEALQPALNAKQAEVNAFIKDNPSNWERQRKGLPPLSEQEEDQRDRKLLELNKEKAALKNRQIDAESTTPPTTTTVPNTTTTTQTVTTGTSSTNQAVDPLDDDKLSQENEAQLNTTTSPANAATARSGTPVSPEDDPFEAERLEREQALNDEPIEFEPADVDPEDDPFEAERLEREQALNQQDLADTATEAEPVDAEQLGNDYGFTSEETDGAGPAPLGEPEPVTLSDEEILARQNAGGLSDEEILARNPTPVTLSDEEILARQNAGNLSDEEILARNPPPVALSDEEILARQNAGGLSDEEILARQEVTNNQSAAAFKARAKSQGTLQSRYKQPGNGDWRVRLSLAPYSDYLYNATGAGILAPLTATNGVIFPYTPNISTTYSADYEKYNLIHSNYRGLFYKSSSVGDVQIRGTFTAQDTREAAYMLAVIHFFRSVTKMFYGQDAERGTPPPLVYLSGYGDQQFSSHPCVVGSFNYSLPNEVDYIRTNGPNNFGPNMSNRQTPTASSPGGANFAGAIRLANALLNKGAIPQLPAANALRSAVNNTNECTYVPTKMEIDITLIPVQTRSQVSKQFSLKEFANGNLLKKGFW